MESVSQNNILLSDWVNELLRIGVSASPDLPGSTAALQHALLIHARAIGMSSQCVV